MKGNVVQATVKGVRISDRKMKPVARIVMRRSVADALVILDHTPRFGAKHLTKVIKSAEANAINNNRLDKNSLVIDSIIIGKATPLKRFKAGAQGSAKPFIHRITNITVTLIGEPRKSNKIKGSEVSEQKGEEK